MSIDQTAQHLAAIPELAAWLPIVLIDGPKPEGATSSTPGSRVPINVTVAALLDERVRYNWEQGMAWCDPDRQGVLPYLDGWVRDIEASLYEVGVTELAIPESPATVASSCAWLASYLVNIFDLPQWPEFASGIAEVHAALASATAPARLDGPRPASCGSCKQGGIMRQSEPGVWVCDRCLVVRTVTAVTLREAAKATHWPLRTLQRWARRRAWKRVEDGQGRVLYDLGTIQAAVAEAKMRKVLGVADDAD